jgi:ABC-type transport system involved in cytochrome bd biosynthesis fused ATPase/permease subunit
MSVYGPKIRFPKIGFPRFALPNLNLKKILPIIVAILIIALILLLVSFADFNSHITISWKNNPLTLTSTTLEKTAELTINLVNDTDTKKDITLNVTTESSEIIIFCPDRLCVLISCF